MLTGTHIKLAKYIYHILKKEYGIRLNKKHLVYGSIKPDFTKNKVPHYIDKSIDYIAEEIERLITESNKIGTKAFSRRLGMIMHYISDYFCRAHNTEYYRRNLMPHLKYEKRLAKVMKNIRNRPVIAIQDCGRVPQNLVVTLQTIREGIKYEMYFESIKDYIIELNKEYMQKKSLEQDKEYTIKAINCVCGYIAERIRENISSKVA